MVITSLYIFYAWVVVIHAAFIGISAFALWGKKLERMQRWQVLLLLTGPIVFLEFYWIPYAYYLELSLHTSHPEVLNFFQLKKATNIRDQFGIAWYHPFIFSCGTLLAHHTGQWTYFKNK